MDPQCRGACADRAGFLAHLPRFVIFRRSGTPFQPWRPTRIIAAQDIYARTRNPVVQGLLIVVLGIAVLFGSDGTMLMLMPAAMLMHYGVVLREENYLERRFGESYRQYQAAVPRYGWPFAGFAQSRSKP
jgi:protein-S-isoprenylcysteine O-methyltransferase Ste14